MFLNNVESGILSRLVFVYDSRTNHERAIATALRRYLLAHRPPYGDAVFLAHIALARCKVRSPLIWDGYEEISAATLPELRDYQRPSRYIHD
jgi:hypothetical protein